MPKAPKKPSPPRKRGSSPPAYQSESAARNLTESYFAERAARANLEEAFEILKRAGVGRKPDPGDELPTPN